MKLTTSSNFMLVILLVFSTIATAQNLTISSSGETTSPGTNWSIIENVLYIGNSGDASINTSVITNHLQNTGDLTINLPGQLNVARNIYINNTIAYSGSSARSLTFQSGNDIVFANAVGITSATAGLNIVLRSATTTATPDNGSVKMDGININTKGGHLWVGGGASTTTWNGLNVGNSAARTYLDDVAGISLVGSTIASGGGNIIMYAQSWNTGDDDGVNYGINVENSSISSGTGSINFSGGVYGRYNNGIGMRVNGTSATSITSTTGAITIYGYGTDATTNGNFWRTATMINGSVSIKSGSGNIAVTGQAAFASPVNDKEGLVISDGSAICSQTGNITLNGTNTLESSGQYSNSIRFAAANVANSIRIGYDGTNAYSGNITIEGNSIYQRSTHAGAGSIAVQTTGTLTIQPTGTVFTYMRASDAGTLTFDNDWNFGTNLGGFAYGKTTNTTPLTYSNALTTNGPITIYAGALDQSGAISSSGAITFNCASFSLGDGKNLSTSTASDITINANDHFGTAGSNRRTISSANGSIIIHADKDANGSGTLDLDYLTFNPGTGATIIKGETVGFSPGSVSGPYINGTGSFTIQSSDASFGPGIYTSWFEIDQDNNGIGGLTLGKIGNTTDIQQNTSLTVSGPVNMYGSNIVSTASLTASSSDLSLYASTAVTQTSPIIAAGLSLNGTGTFTLTNTSNNFTTLAGGAAGSLIGATQIVDVSGGLTIGTVGSNIGLTGSNTIRVETLAGDLTLAGNISTTSTSIDAVILTAAKSTAIGVPTGGDILVTDSPTISMGAGAIAKLYSGYDVTSTGLADLVGGASNLRINYDETTTTFNPVLSADNKYAIYRTAFGYGDLNIVSSGGDAEGSTWTYVNGVITTTSGTANVLNTVVQTKLNSANLSIEANKVTFSANVTGTTSNSFNVLSKAHIVNTNATTITTQGGNVLFASNVDDATDGESTTNGYIQFSSGLTITTNGGNVTLGGGDSSASGYALGTSAYPYEGIRVDGTLNINSGGGNINMQGKSYAISTTAGAWGVGFWNLSTGSIASGAGAITLDGFSQSSGGTHNSGLYTYGALTVTSTNSTTDAIRLIGKSTGTNGEAWGIEAESALSLIATGEGGGITMSSSQQDSANNYDIVLRGETNILAKSGPINLLGGQSVGIANGTMFLGSNVYLGSKALSDVPSSSSDITIQYDLYNFSGYNPKLATSGTLNWKPVSASFGQNVATNYFAWSQNSQTLSGLTIGKSGNTVNVYLNSSFTVVGPISVYGGYVEVSSTITSSGNYDILLKGIANTGSCVNISGGITKSSGTGTLNMQGHGRVNNAGIITTSGTGVLNIIFWSDFDGDNVGGGSTHSGTISTNGGHIWMGGSNTNGGSYSWNGLAVGDGPSVGAAGANSYAIDMFGHITTNGGDLLLWAGNSCCSNVANGIVTNDAWQLNVGNGDIVLITPSVLGSGPSLLFRQNGGTFTLVPNGTSFPNTLNWYPQDNVYNGMVNWNFPDDFNYLWIENPATLTNLSIGWYDGMTSGGTPVVFSNTSNININLPTTIAGSMIFNGGTITLNAGLTTTNNGDISLYSDNAIAGLSSQRNVTAAGQFNYIPQSNSFGAAVTYPITNLNVSSTGLLIGKPTNTANVTFGAETSIAGPITAYGGTIAVNAALTATNSNINLTASIAATQTAAITANGLALNGAGIFILENTANNIAKIAGGSSAAKIGSLSFVDAAGGLEIATVNPTGITSTGPIKIETLEGNITLSENLATDDTTAGAIILNAGSIAAIGTATGGDIIVIGTRTLTYGTGGRAKLYSGSNKNSIGLTALVGGVTNTRVNVDETTANYSPLLADAISYALYRTEDIQASIISNFNNINKMYHDVNFTIVTPTSNSIGSFSYISSNTDVATISGTTVTILSAGTSTITANQAADGNFSSGSITALLVVGSEEVLLINGGTSHTNPNYIDSNGKKGGNTSLNKYGQIKTVKTQ